MATNNQTKGLNAQQVKESRDKHGINILTPPPKPSLWIKFFENFICRLFKYGFVILEGVIVKGCKEKHL